MEKANLGEGSDIFKFRILKIDMNKWLIKSEEASLTDYGKYPGSRSVEELIQYGLIPLDKPSGPASNQVDAWVKEILDIKKCSHGGTLDPRVTGVLVIALNEATKLMPILLSSKKEYVALVNLHKEVSKKEITRVCNEFVGKIKQLPPKKSAVARRVRQRKIYYLEILEIDGRNILMKVGCEAGTYIRRLADDIGKKLGTGAHLQELRRTKTADFEEDKLFTIQDLSDAVVEWKNGSEENIRKIILPLERVFDNLGIVIVKDTTVGAITNGAPLGVNGISKIKEGIKKGDLIGIFTLKGELVAIGKAQIDSEQMISKKKGLAVKTDRVIMKSGTYPKTWKV